MKVLIFSGNHARHLYVHREIVNNFEIAGVITMEREPTVPPDPQGETVRDRENFTRHFRERDQVESRIYGDLTPEQVYAECKTLYRQPNELNTQETAEFVKASGADVAVIFGVDLIKDPVLSALPKDAINLHLGLSPQYKGSATLFWPFYNLEPQFAGSTIHHIVEKADAGAIIHQVCPKLEEGDGIHDVGAKVVQDSVAPLVEILKYKKKTGEIPGRVQKSTGRLYLTRDFRPEHLRVIYDLYQNRLVDYYLQGKLTDKVPRLIKAPFIDHE